MIKNVIEKITYLNNTLTPQNLDGLLNLKHSPGSSRVKDSKIHIFKSKDKDSGEFKCWMYKDFGLNNCGTLTMLLQDQLKMSQEDIVIYFKDLINDDTIKDMVLSKAIEAPAIQPKKALTKEEKIDQEINHAKELYLLKYKNKDTYIADTKNFLDANKIKNDEPVYNYLVNLRCIDKELYKEFKQKGLVCRVQTPTIKTPDFKNFRIYDRKIWDKKTGEKPEDRFLNDLSFCCFVNINPNNLSEPAGYWLREASDQSKKLKKDPLRMCKTGGDLHNFIYSTCTDDKPETLLVFESAIDLMSYITLFGKIEKAYYLSLNGLHDNVFIQNILKIKKSLKKVIVAVDYDKEQWDKDGNPIKSNRFCLNAKDICNHLNITIERHYAKNYRPIKDWNAALCYVKEPVLYGFESPQITLVIDNMDK